MEEKVSIIIPVYNAGKYLRECLDSVLHQTYNNVEIVAVNDGSTDDSKQILEEYASNYSNIKVFHTENRGVCAARNMGLDNISGEWVMFVDADDYLAKNAIEILYNDAVNHNADILSGLLKDGIEEIVNGNNVETNVWTGIDALEKALEDNRFTYSSCAKLYKRQVVKGVRFVEGRKIHEDSYFVFCVFLQQPTVVTKDVYIYNARANENSASHTAFSEKFFDILYFAEEKWKAIEQNYMQLLDKAKNMLVKANVAMLQCLLNTKDKKYDKDVKNCIATVKKYKKYFIPNYPGDEKRFKIIIWNVYGIYKFIYQLKYAKRIKKAQ